MNISWICRRKYYIFYRKKKKKVKLNPLYLFLFEKHEKYPIHRIDFQNIDEFLLFKQISHFNNNSKFSYFSIDPCRSYVFFLFFFMRKNEAWIANFSEIACNSGYTHTMCIIIAKSCFTAPLPSRVSYYVVFILYVRVYVKSITRTFASLPIGVLFLY